MLKESAIVARVSPSRPQRDLERSEGADPTRELDQNTPDRRWNVEPGSARPPNYQQSSEHHEENEYEVQSEHQVGERPIDQAEGTTETAGPAGASNCILLRSATNRGSPRSESTTGCT